MLAFPPPAPEVWWHKPEWVVGLLTAVITAGLVILGISEYLDRKRKRRLRMCKAIKFNPDEIVAGFRVRGYSDYIPVATDDVAWEVLRDGQSIGLRGRPGIGKSHSAAHYIRKLGLSARGGKHRPWWFLLRTLSALRIPGCSRFSDWYVIRPPIQVLQVANQVRVRKRRYILLLDDINDYVRNDDGTAVLDLVSNLQTQARQLVILSTLRSTAPEDLAVSAVSKIFSRWKWIDLSDWQFDQGVRLAEYCGGDVDKWDGTPRSVKQPSSEMERKYESLEHPAAKAVLRCLLLFRRYGLYSVTRAVLRSACASELFNVGPTEFETALTAVNRFGFLKSGTLYVEAYEPYLDAIHDWAPAGRRDYLVIRDLLVAERHLPELMTIASWWYGEEEFSEAEWISRKCIEMAPRKPSYYFWLGSILWKQKNLKGAEGALVTALGLNPQYQRARSLLAGTWRKLGRIQDAEEAYRKVLRAAPGMFEAIFGFAIVLLDKSDLAGAEEQFREAINVRPDSARAHCFLGEVLWRSEHIDEAQESYRKAIELDPELFEARVGHARLLLGKMDYTGAESESQKAASIKPDSAWAYSLLGEALRGLGKLKDAEAAYRTAVSLEVGRVDHEVGLGIVLMDEADYEGARDVFSQVVNSDPTFWRAHSYLGEAFAFLGQFENAEKSYLRAAQIDPSRTEPLTGLGMTRLKKGDFAGAEEVFRKSLEIKPDEWVYTRLGDALNRQEKFDEAEEMYERGMSSDPEVLRERFNHGLFCLTHGRLAHAETCFRNILKFDADNLAAYSRLAEALIRQGRHSELKGVVDRIVELVALELNQDKAAVYYFGPGMAASACEDWETAKYFFQKTIAQDPSYARAFQHLGYALINLKCYKDATMALREAIRLNPLMSKAQYFLGKSMFEEGNYGDAEAALRRSIEIKGTYGDAHKLLGDTLERRGKHDEAAEAYRVAARLNPELGGASYTTESSGSVEGGTDIDG